jgi:hypothetical protein
MKTPRDHPASWRGRARVAHFPRAKARAAPRASNTAPPRVALTERARPCRLLGDETRLRKTLRISRADARPLDPTRATASASPHGRTPAPIASNTESSIAHPNENCHSGTLRRAVVYLPDDKGRLWETLRFAKKYHCQTARSDEAGRTDQPLVGGEGRHR